MEKELTLKELKELEKDYIERGATYGLYEIRKIIKEKEGEEG